MLDHNCWDASVTSGRSKCWAPRWNSASYGRSAKSQTFQSERSSAARGLTPHSQGFFGSMPAIIEVTTAADDDRMSRAARKIAKCASTLRSGAGAHLRFDFQEADEWEKGKYRRRRRVTGNFEFDALLSDQLARWLLHDRRRPLHLQNQAIDVYIDWSEKASRHLDIYSRMPHVAYSLTDNPVFKVLNSRAKTRQLQSAPPGLLRCIFLADAGCSILTRMYHKDPLGRERSGADIINHYLRKNKADILCVFVPAPEERVPFFLELNCDGRYQCFITQTR